MSTMGRKGRKNLEFIYLRIGIFLIILKVTLYFFYHSIWCPIRRLLYISTLFPVDIFYHSTLCHIWRLLHLTLFPVDVFFFFDVLSLWAFITFARMSFRHYLPFNVFVLSTFFTFQRFFCRPFVPWRLLSSAFFTSTFCRWIIIWGEKYEKDERKERTMWKKKKERQKLEGKLKVKGPFKKGEINAKGEKDEAKKGA